MPTTDHRLEQRLFEQSVLADMPSPEITVLRQHIEQLVPLRAQDVVLLNELVTIRHLPRRAVIDAPGSYARTMYFVVKGLLKLSYLSTEGTEHILGFAYEDWWEGDFQAFLHGAQTELRLSTVEPTTLCCFSFAAYTRLCAEIPTLERFFLAKATAGFAASQQRILSLMTADATSRYHRLLQTQPVLLQRVSKTQLAAYLGVSRETLSRLRRE